MTWPLVFRLHPEGRSLFARVVVHRTKKAMREHWRRELQEVAGLAGPWAKRIGYCREVQRWMVTPTTSRRDPCFAEVHLYASRCGTEVVTHEMFHATAAWGRRVRFDFKRLGDADSVNDDEERMAYVHGWLCRQFVDRAWAAGVYSVTGGEVHGG